MRLHLIAAATLIVGACAPMSEASDDGLVEVGSRTPGRCFNPDQVRNFRQGRSGQLFVRASNSQVFEIDSAGCTGLDFANRVAIVPTTSLAGSRVCTLDSVTLAVPGATSTTDVCRGRVMRVLTADEVAALPDHQRP